MYSILNYLSKLKPHKNRKCAKRSFSLSLLDVQSELWFDINAYNGQANTGIEPTLLPLPAGLNQRTLTILSLMSETARNIKQTI